MIDNLPNVPPALLLLLQEMAKYDGSWSDMRRRVRGMLRDLRDQSEAFDVENLKRESDTKNSLRYEIHLHGALDVLSEEGCQNVRCRIRAAERIAQSVGLIADRVWLTDTLSERFSDFGRATNDKLDKVMVDALVLSQLLPLILTGVVRFRSPWISTCSACLAAFESHVKCSAKDVAQIFRRDLKLQRQSDGNYFLDTGQCYEPGMVYQTFFTEPRPKSELRTITEDWFTKQLHSIFWRAREAALTGGSIVSNSRVGLAGLLHEEGRLLNKRPLLLLDKERQFSVPWVNELDALQIVQLREEASAALPAFREKMARAMSVSSLDKLSSTSPSEIVAELREQAVDVRSELEAKRKNSSRYWKTTYGLLGLGLSAYGVASDQIMPGVGGLLPIIHLLINHKTGYETDVSKLTSRPGFVLVKAQDILLHAH